MYSLFNQNNRFNKKNTLLITVFIISLMITAAGCQTVGNNNDHNIESPDAVLHVIIYGKVDSLSTKKVSNKYVLFIPHRYQCTDSTGLSDAVLHWAARAHISPLGKFYIHYTFPPKLLPGKPQCITASVVSYDVPKASTPREYVEYDSLLAGPKKLGNDFVSHFRGPTKANPNPTSYDTVRVDFTLPDSSKFSK
jgi:hypothetical protein